MIRISQLLAYRHEDIILINMLNTNEGKPNFKRL